jgi:hypothetical protein
MPAKHAGRAGQGLLVAVRRSLCLSVAQWPTNPASGALWVRIRHPHETNCYFIAAAYVPPSTSDQFALLSLDERLKMLHRQISEASAIGTVLMGGDFNGKIGTLPTPTPPPTPTAGATGVTTQAPTPTPAPKATPPPTTTSSFITRPTTPTAPPSILTIQTSAPVPVLAPTSQAATSPTPAAATPTPKRRPVFPRPPPPTGSSPAAAATQR